MKGSQFVENLKQETPRIRRNLSQNLGNISALYATRRGTIRRIVLKEIRRKRTSQVDMRVRGAYHFKLGCN